MEIRPARDRDRDAIADLQAASWRASYRGMLSDDYLDKRVGGDLRRHWRALRYGGEDLLLAAEADDGALAGFIAVWCRPSPYIDNLHVATERKGQGIGKSLMAAAAERLRRRGHGTAYLWVFENNRPAIAFYEALAGSITARETRAFFGQSVPSIKIEWTDLAAVSAAAAPPG